MGVIGGRLGYQLLRRLGGSPPRRDLCSGAAYRDRSKLEVLLGPGIWRDCADKVVLDFGCGAGDDAVEMAQRGARRVIGLDIRESVLQVARPRRLNRSTSSSRSTGSSTTRIPPARWRP
jgi:2-polyprenyl-3-methyl-5-hydroxy-6-metoxy-1,4-benzoquinol methylase